MFKPVSIYIASSFKNIHAVQLLRDKLQEHGFVVFDWTAFAPPISENTPSDVRRTLFDTDERGEIFTYCTEACGKADLVIYIGQAGQDAAAEIGMAYVSGVPVLGLLGSLEKPGLIVSKIVEKWFGSVQELMSDILDFRLKQQEEV